MQVRIDKRGGSADWDEASIERLALFALERMDVPECCEVSISLVGPDEIQLLNHEYRGVDSVTDVLSFPCDDPFAKGLEPVAHDEPIELGDVVMCCDVIDEQRAEFGTSFEQEASLMLVHSLLHLLGYDHMEPDDAQAMEAREKDILDAYGLTGIR